MTPHQLGATRRAHLCRSMQPCASRFPAVKSVYDAEHGTAYVASRNDCFPPGPTRRGRTCGTEGRCGTCGGTNSGFLFFRSVVESRFICSTEQLARRAICCLMCAHARVKSLRISPGNALTRITRNGSMAHISDRDQVLS